MKFESGFYYLKHLCFCKIRPDIIWGACEALYKFEVITLDEYCIIMGEIKRVRDLTFLNEHQCFYGNRFSLDDDQEDN